MFFLPSHRRPERLQECLDQCVATQMTSPLVIILDEGGKGYENIRYPHFVARVIKYPEEVTLGQKNHDIFVRYPNLSYYGWLGDDAFPITDHWDIKIREAAGITKMVAPEDKLKSKIYLPGCFAIGGDLVRAAGFFVPHGFVHWYQDNVWQVIINEIGADKIWHHLDDVIVEHRHCLNGLADEDETYKRAMFGKDPGHYDRQDQERFENWMRNEAFDIIKNIKEKLKC